MPGRPCTGRHRKLQPFQTTGVRARARGFSRCPAIFRGSREGTRSFQDATFQDIGCKGSETVAGRELHIAMELRGPAPAFSREAPAPHRRPRRRLTRLALDSAGTLPAGPPAPPAIDRRREAPTFPASARARPAASQIVLGYQALLGPTRHAQVARPTKPPKRHGMTDNRPAAMREATHPHEAPTPRRFSMGGSRVRALRDAPSQRRTKKQRGRKPSRDAEQLAGQATAVSRSRNHPVPKGAKPA